MTIKQTAGAVAMFAIAAHFLPVWANAGGRSLTDCAGSSSLGSEQTIDISLEEGSSRAVDGYAIYGARGHKRVAQGSVPVASFFARITSDQVEAGEVIRFAIDGDTVLSFAAADGSLCKVELKLEWPKLRRATTVAAVARMYPSPVSMPHPSRNSPARLSRPFSQESRGSS